MDVLLTPLTPHDFDISVCIMYTISQFTKLKGEQDSLVVKAADFGSKGPRFDPQQQLFVQLPLWWFKQSHTNS